MQNDHDIERYLLGELPEDDMARFDRDALANDLLATRVAAVEDALVDAYVRGELGADRRARIEARLLASERGRERVAFARALMDRADRQPTASATPQVAVRSRSSARWLAWAAVLAVAVLAGWMLVTRGPDVPDETRVTALLVANVRAGDTPSVVIGPETTLLALEVALDGTGAVAGETATVRLLAPDGRIAYGPERLAVRLVGGLPALIAEVAPDALPPGAYRLEVTPAGQADDAATVYPFALVRADDR